MHMHIHVLYLQGYVWYLELSGEYGLWSPFAHPFVSIIAVMYSSSY